METDELIEKKNLESIPVWISILLYIVVFFICMGVFGILARVLLTMVLGDTFKETDLVYYIVMESCMLLAVLIPAIIFLYFERRPFSDLGLVFKGHVKDLGYGALMAFVLFLVGFVLSLALGVVDVTSFHFDWMPLIGSFLFFILVALAEEIMMRGYILGHLLHTKLNKFLSLFISSLLFAAMHLLNPNVAFLPMLNLVLAGMLLGASYLYTRNLCFPIGLHLFWNWIQGPVLGYQVSGNTFGTSLFKLQLSDDTLLNGGAFGFEGSLICTVLMIVFTILIIWWGEKREAISLVTPQSC